MESLSFQNPILPGFHPDPTLCRVGEDYYLVTSTFEYFPGLPIHHSRDLVNWEVIGHALDRVSQLPLEGARCSGGLYAPTLRYHDGTFYLICTNVSHRGNFVVTTRDIRGPWSEPHYIEDAEGIDPSLLFDEDGRCWYCGNGAPETPLYEGHRNIWLQEFDPVEFRLIGDKHILVDGGVDITKNPIWIEGPHIYRIGDWYYLFAAEGGTEVNHCEVVFRSRSVTGPYEPGPTYPFLTNRHLPADRLNPITCTGHADLVQTQTGEWWMVLLACRPNTAGQTHLGRETFLVPVTWEDEWPVVAGGILEAEYAAPDIFTGPISDAASAIETLGWRERTFLRNPDSENPFWRVAVEVGGYSLTHLPATLSELASPAFMGTRQRHHRFSASVALVSHATNKVEQAGLAYLYSNEAYFTLTVRPAANGALLVEVERNHRGDRTTLASERIAEATMVRLGLAVDFDKVSFTLNGHGIGEPHYDASFMNSTVSGGFVGCFVGIYATSQGEPSTATTTFSGFKYMGLPRD